MLFETHDQSSIREYYGKVLQGSRDLKTNACCSTESQPRYVREILAAVEPEIVGRFYGCGSPIPDAIEGCTVLDLGCGTGRDVFVCARLAGESGQVIGIDMTDEQLEVGRHHLERQMERFGFRRPNVRLVKGYMEDLGAAGIEDASVDAVISNCVINLSPDKERVFAEIFRVLKPGGELHFSDIFADRRLPASWRDDPVLLGECLAGAMYPEDFRRLLDRLGSPDHRLVASRPVTVDNAEVEAKVGSARFHAATVRAFKLASLEDRCEDYGQVATYLGTIAHAPHAYVLDDHHVLETDRPMRVCGNTAAMLEETRLTRHFRVEGDRSRHFGLFDCGPPSAARLDDSRAAGACC